MQVTPPPIQPLDNPIGELLLETVKAAPILPVKLMDAVADYVSYQSAPRMMIDPAFEHKTIAQKLFGGKK